METRDRTFLTIQNFKSLKDVKVEIKPITLLFGPNGSGKSTLLDAISIFCNSVWGWFRNDVDRKEFVKNLDFDSLVNSENKSEGSFTIGWHGILDSKKFNFQISYKKINHNTGIDSIFFEMFDKEIKLWSLTINPDILFEVAGQLELKRLIPLYKSLGLSTIAERMKLNFEEGGIGEFKAKEFKFKRLKTYWEPASELVDNLDSDISLKLLEYLLCRRLLLIFYPELTQKVDVLKDSLEIMALTEGTEEIFNISAAEILETNKYSIKVMNMFEKFMDVEAAPYLANFQKMEDVRKNPPDFFESISGNIVNDYFGLCKLLLDLEKDDNTTNRIKEKEKLREKLILLLKEFQIADEIIVKSIGKREPNRTFYQIQLKSGEQTFPLKNLSSGGKQILPIIMMLVFDDPVYFTMRQPELHLHPKLQTKIPEILVELQKQTEIVI